MTLNNYCLLPLAYQFTYFHFLNSYYFYRDPTGLNMRKKRGYDDDKDDGDDDDEDDDDDNDDDTDDTDDDDDDNDSN